MGPDGSTHQFSTHPSIHTTHATRHVSYIIHPLIVLVNSKLHQWKSRFLLPLMASGSLRRPLHSTTLRRSHVEGVLKRGMRKLSQTTGKVDSYGGRSIDFSQGSFDVPDSDTGHLHMSSITRRTMGLKSFCHRHLCVCGHFCIYSNQFQTLLAFNGRDTDFSLLIPSRLWVPEPA